MDLTTENKQHIDSLTYEELLRHNRYAPCGDPWFMGETGAYWVNVMAEKKNLIGPGAAVGVSKRIDWDG